MVPQPTTAMVRTLLISMSGMAVSCGPAVMSRAAYRGGAVA